MLKLKQFAFNDFMVNCFILYHETGDCAIVDASCSNESENQVLSSFIKENQLTPKHLINTHCHVDHLLGNKFIYDEYGLTTACHTLDVFLIDEAVQHAAMFGLKAKKPPAPGQLIEEGDELEIGNSKLEVLHVPGHSPGSVALYNADTGICITGDALFNGSIGRTDLPGGDYNTLIDSIRRKLLVLPDDVRIFPGHGPESTIGNEKRSNPFLQ